MTDLRSLTFAVVAGVAALLGLAACGEGETSLPASAGTETPTQTPAPTPTPTPTPTLQMSPEGDALALALKSAVDTARADAGIPAMAAAIVTADGGMIAAAVSGERRAGSGVAVTVDDLWHIGSDTKAITAAMFARRVDQGRAQWGMPLVSLLGDVADGADAGWADIPVEAFLAHRSGIDQFPGVFLLTARVDEADLKTQRANLLSERLASPPGPQRGAFEYSNFGYVAVGAALESGGAPWEDQVAEFLTATGLEIGEFGFGPPLGDQPEGHRYGRPMGQNSMADNPLAMGPAGTMHFTLGGWAKFVRLFLVGGGDVLSPASIERLMTPWPAQSDYALGWGVETGANGEILVLYHAGSNTFWFAQAVVFPAEGFAVLIVANDGGPAASEGVQALTAATEALARERMTRDNSPQ